MRVFVAGRFIVTSVLREGQCGELVLLLQTRLSANPRKALMVSYAVEVATGKRAEKSPIRGRLKHRDNAAVFATGISRYEVQGSIGPRREAA